MFIRMSTSFVMLLGLTVLISAGVPVSDMHDSVTKVARADLKSAVLPLSEPSSTQLGAHEGVVTIWRRYPDAPPTVQATYLHQ